MKNHRSFTCSVCKQTKEPSKDGISTGYGTDQQGNKICFDCCGKRDVEELHNLPIGGKTIQYWDGKHVINWPGTLSITPAKVVVGKHNIARTQTLVYFNLDRHRYLGKQYGNFTQILHVTRLKD